MKKTLALLVLMVCSLGMLQAQSYNALWKKAVAAQEDDLPRTALDIVSQIQQKAEHEGNTAQLIRALCHRVLLGEDISNDSLTVEIGRMRAYRDAETRPVERALWNVVMAEVCTQRAYADTAFRSFATQCFEESLRDFNALSHARTNDYLPLFDKGKQSAYFKHDVLHVLARHYINDSEIYDRHTTAIRLLGRLAAHYDGLGNREAALLWRLDSAGKENVRTYNVQTNDCFLRLRQLAEENRHLKLNAATYVAMTKTGYRSRTNDSLLSLIAEEGIRLYPRTPQATELRNYLLNVRNPRLSLNGLPEVLYPGKGYDVRLNFKALTTCEVRIYRFDGVSAQDFEHFDFDADEAPVTLVRTYPFSVHAEPPYVEQDTTVRFVAPDEPGIYRIALFDGKRESGSNTFYCTTLKYMLLTLENGDSRVNIVDALSGKPLPGTKMALCSSPYERRNRISENLRPAADGSYLINVEERKNRTAYISLGKDNALPGFTLDSRSSYNQGAPHHTSLRLYTDRGIYRPGQQVIVGGFVFTQQADSTQAESESPVTVKLYDSNRKLVSQKKFTTDEFGAFEGRFDLPTTVLPGTFTLRAEGQCTPTTMHIEVQEYKRPTFTVETDPVTRTYQPGDTLLITGTARTYSGLPVEGARVSYETQRFEYIYWYRRGNEDAFTLQRGDTITDGEGRFCIPVVLQTGGSRSCRTHFNTRIDVTAQHGETQSTWNNTYVSYRSAYLVAEWPETVCFEHAPSVTPRLLNAQGNNVDATGVMTVSLGKNVVFTDSIRTAQPVTITRDRLPAAGKYTIETVVESGGETFKATSNVRFFSETDTRPVSGDKFWYHIRKSEAGDSAYVIIGSTAHDVTMFYDVYNGKNLLESHRAVFSDSLLHYNLGWQPHYGDGVNVTFAFVKEGELYQQDVSLVKPQPDKRLKIGWVTFRSLLTPGQQEEWRLRVSLPDGTPARASVMARLYDASLDALRNYQWYFGHSFPRYVPHSSWSSKYVSSQSVSGSYPLNLADTPEWHFTHLSPTLFSLYADSGEDYATYNAAAAGMVYRAESTADRAMPMSMRLRGMPAESEGATMEYEEEYDGDGMAKSAAADEAAAVVPRTNFNETAFFYPTLRTDEGGEVSIAFTLPESLTQWNFRALAHTVDMRYATSDTSAVARKEFMVEPAMPRFVREGDKAQIPVTVRNLTETPLDGTLLLQVLDPATEKVVLTQDMTFTSPANGSVVRTFSLEANRLPGVVTVRITGKSGLFGDGEEHYLPVLSAREQVIATLPFTVTQQMMPTLRIDTLWSKSSRMADRMLTVEATSNPTWYAVTALPMMADRTCYSSTDWAERLYAVVLARHIAEQNPAIRKAFADTALTTYASALARNEDLKNTIAEETPWLAESEDEAARAAALATLFDAEQNALKEHTALDRLRKLQNTDGSWSWCPGMQGSTYMTSRIVVILARLQHLTGYTTDMLDRAYDFLEKEIAEYVPVAKKKKYTGCPYPYLRYLYAASLTDRQPASSDMKKAVNFLVEQVEADVNSEDMHTKSLCAVVLARYGKDKAAQTALQSLIEHTTIGDPMRGRYFDTRRAPMTWSSYRIPTQTSTMEALTMCAPEMVWNADGKFIASRNQALTEMRLWLLQSKRTQMWETSSASLDAIYALLLENGTTPTSDLTREATPLRYTLKNTAGRIIKVNSRSDVHSAETLGYICDRYSDTPAVDARSITLSGYENSVSWGSVYARYTMPVEDVVAAGKGLGVARCLEVRRDGKWVAFDATSGTLTTGDRLRVVFTLSADRDYDYVSLRTGRPACTEPTDRLSGYRWTEAGGCYRAVRDTDLQYFFEKLPKGTHTFTDELLIDRAGTYTFAPARLQSLYSPEFQGISEAATLTIAP